MRMLFRIFKSFLEFFFKFLKFSNFLKNFKSFQKSRKNLRSDRKWIDCHNRWDRFWTARHCQLNWHVPSWLDPTFRIGHHGLIIHPWRHTSGAPKLRSVNFSQSETISQFLERIPMEHIESKNSWDFELQTYFTCSIKIPSKKRVIFDKPLQNRSNWYIKE